MADSLFDKRYRYDYIYPRGRSGETLRAIDTHEHDRPVVIKRPASLDAPPIRAGQEVSIANERRALKQLSGHPVLATLVGDGQFMVGGTAHQYIVMERAEGMVVAEAVSELNAIGERLPMLEILVIVDNLLDLLNVAHSKGIVYNDVDAKHLFWNRETYTLKVIDWGNAIFLEGDDMTPQGISRQTDIFQVGQLLYHLVTGGRRADIPRDAGSDFAVDFGDDVRRVHSRLQEMISRALHPNARLRYPTINALRGELATFRQPLERERNTAVATVTERLKRDDLSKNDLRTLKTMIEPALAQDPGYPTAQQAHATIIDRLRDLAVEADLDAVRIYIEAGSWSRASDLLTQLREKAGSQTGALINFLLDACEILESNRSTTTAINTAIQMTFKGQTAEAAKLLMLNPAPDNAQTMLQWAIAERISSHFSDVLLLRPNLYRLNIALTQLEKEGYTAPEPQAVLSNVEKTLDLLASGNIDLPGLRDGYRSVVEQLALVNPIMQTFAFQHQLSGRQLPLNSLDRATNAAMALADAMHVIGRQATSSPRDALQALDTSRVIDPTNPVWDDVEYLLKRLYDRLQACQTYVPSADGSDLQAWLKSTQSELEPFVTRLFDEMLAKMLQDLDLAENAWQGYREAVIQGDRETAVETISDATDAVITISPTLSAWFKHLRVVVEGANYIERHSVPNAIGRTIADGWEAFDRGKLIDSEKLGQQAYEIAKNEAEYEVSKRLQDISSLTREWVDRNGVSNAPRTQTILNEIEKRFTPEEKRIQDNFNAQMPSIETYLKAMSRGLVDVYAQRSSGALRLLFVKYILLGTLDTHEGRLADAEFWREAATRTLGDNATRHPATRTLDEFIARKRDLNTAQALFARLNGKQALSDLENTRRQLETNPQAKLLSGGIQSIRDLETALRDWSDGDFRSGGMKLENALKGIAEVEQGAGFSLKGYRAWLMELMSVAAELLVQFRETRGIIEQRPDQPDHRVYDCFHDMVRVTTKYLGDDYAATLRTWRDTYDQFLAVYTGDDRRSKRLERMNELFRAMFIDRQPAYPLYRHWFDVLERSSEFPAPPTNDPTPRIATDGALPDDELKGSKYNETAPSNRRRLMPWILVGIPIVILLALAGVAFLASQNNRPSEIVLTISPTPIESVSDATVTTSDGQVAIVATTPAPSATVAVATQTPTPRPTTPIPSNTPTPMTPTVTSTFTMVPSNTPTITLTPSATATPMPATNTPLPPQGIQGTVDLLALFSQTSDLPFNPEFFTPIENGYRLGIGEASTGDILQIAPSADLLEANYGNNAVSRIRRVDAEMTLRTFNPSVVSAEDVYFGMLLESTADGNNIGLRVQVVSPTVINIYAVSNNETRFLSQKSVNAVIVRLRIERDVTSGDVSLYYNDELLDEPLVFLASDAPLLPSVFVHNGGVVVGVNTWRVTLR
jgi:serine/threonine protein kinase